MKGVSGNGADSGSRRTKSWRSIPTVAETMADALGCDVDDIKPDVSLIEGLDAESIDFLDMVFRLERAFKIKIPRGKIVENARGDLPEAEFEQKGIVTDKGLAQLREYLSEVPAERFKTPMKVADIPRLFTPETFCKLVVRAQQAAQAAESPRHEGRLSASPVRRTYRAVVSDPTFAAFSFVDRITAFEPGKRRARNVRGSRAASPRFRRASSPKRSGSSRRGSRWTHIDFRGRPGRGAGQRDAVSRATRSPGDALELDVDIDRLRRRRRRLRRPREHRRRARRSSSSTASGRCCRSTDFDAPEALRERFALLRGGGATPGRFAASASCRST